MPDGEIFAFHDLAPGEDSFRDAVLAGLSATPKSLPCKFFYDQRGSALFEAICEVPEYYLTRTELGILKAQAPVIAARIGAHCRLIELGSGASRKVRLLLNALEAPLAYVAIDISRGFLRESAASIAADFPELEVVAVYADYTRPLALPKIAGPAGKTVGFFPGSTIGNFEPEAVVAFLRHCGALLGAGAEMLIGVDVKKDKAVLDAAYNDAQGLNAAFNLNLLRRIRDELDSDIAIDDFAHVAFYNPDEGRVELYIRSLKDQTATIAGRRFSFNAGEMIHTENSYKYAIAEFQALAARAGFRALDTWTDGDAKFSLHYLRRD
ncbi:MAG TPA: L-histidine N(alpha)-methyltransferase [Stellaceae bacterium]|nr:L-histidine N(alpha)-methyltransferase [Stellaceae bacterium]